MHRTQALKYSSSISIPLAEWVELEVSLSSGFLGFLALLVECALCFCRPSSSLERELKLVSWLSSLSCSLPSSVDDIRYEVRAR